MQETRGERLQDAKVFAILEGPIEGVAPTVPKHTANVASGGAKSADGKRASARTQLLRDVADDRS